MVIALPDSVCRCSISPGPSLALVVRTALAHGRLAGVTVALAHGVGVAIYALAVVFGVSGLVTRVDGAMLVIQILGASFIIYLGAKMLRAGLKGLMVGDTGPLHPDNEYSSISDKVTAVCTHEMVYSLSSSTPKLSFFSSLSSASSYRHH